MSKKGSARFALLLAIPALSLMSQAAQAGTVPHWYSDGKLITGQPVPVTSIGQLTFDLTQFGASVACTVTDRENVWNPATGAPGRDRLIAFKLSACATTGTIGLCATNKVLITAVGLPWATNLVAVTPPALGARDVIKGVRLAFRCTGGKVLGTAKGVLSPGVGASVFLFQGASLLAPFGAVTVAGSEKLTGPPGDTTISAA